MTIDVSALQTFTLAEQLTLVEYAIAHLMVGGQSYSIAGRTYTRADLDDLIEWRDKLKDAIAESGSVTGTLDALVKFGEAS